MTSPRAFGADQVRIGKGGEIELLCPFAKSWTPRGARTLTSSEHPGTAVEWNGRIFEVLDADPTAGRGMRYRLAAWEDRHAIRRLERYDEVSETIREGDRRDRRRDFGKRRLAILLVPLAGLLPADFQKKMERDFGAPALKMTIASAVPLFFIGFLGLVAFLVGNAGGTMDLPGWIAPSLPIAAYLFGESALRLASAIAGQEPMGSLPVAIAFAVWQSVGRPKEAPADGSSQTTATELDEQGLQDRFRVLEPVLAFLSTSEQEFFAGRFGFDAVRWGGLRRSFFWPRRRSTRSSPSPRSAPEMGSCGRSCGFSRSVTSSSNRSSASRHSPAENPPAAFSAGSCGLSPGRSSMRQPPSIRPRTARPYRGSPTTNPATAAIASSTFCASVRPDRAGGLKEWSPASSHATRIAAESV
jgi:hypothetical protein